MEYNYPPQVHPHASAVCMDTVLEQAPVSGLAVACVETVLEHGCPTASQEQRTCPAED